MDSSIKNEISPAKNILFFFVFSSIGSFMYAVYYGRLNGDFLGIPVQLSFFELLINLVLNVLPFYVIWRFYLKFKKGKKLKHVSIPMSFFSKFLFLLIFWNILVTYLFGVGVMAAPPYEAPGGVKVIIQIMNRFNYTYGVFIYLLICDKKDKKQWLFVLLLLVLAYMRAGLGVFLYLFMIYYLKYYSTINVWIKKRILLLIVLFFFIPTSINYLYDLRANLRNQQSDDVVLHPITGMLLGRLSSFSDSAFILQNSDYFKNRVESMSPFYFQQQALGGIVNVDLMPEIRPEKLLFTFFNINSEEHISYMPGTNGNLYFSYFKSELVLIMNFLTYLLYIYLTFNVLSRINFKYNLELGVILLGYVGVSGVSNEYAFIVFSIFVFFLIFLFIKR